MEKSYCLFGKRTNQKLTCLVIQSNSHCGSQPLNGLLLIACLTGIEEIALALRGKMHTNILISFSYDDKSHCLLFVRVTYSKIL